MKTPCKLRLSAFLVAVVLTIGGLAARPCQPYATYNPPNGPHYHADPVLTAGLLLNPTDSLSTQWVNPPGGHP